MSSRLEALDPSGRAATHRVYAHVLRYGGFREEGRSVPAPLRQPVDELARWDDIDGFHLEYSSLPTRRFRRKIVERHVYIEGHRNDATLAQHLRLAAAHDHVAATLDGSSEGLAGEAEIVALAHAILARRGVPAHKPPERVLEGREWSDEDADLYFPGWRAQSPEEWLARNRHRVNFWPHMERRWENDRFWAWLVEADRILYENDEAANAFEPDGRWDRLRRTYLTEEEMAAQDAEGDGLDE